MNHRLMLTTFIAMIVLSTIAYPLSMFVPGVLLYHILVSTGSIVAFTGMLVGFASSMVTGMKYSLWETVSSLLGTGLGAIVVSIIF